MPAFQSSELSNLAAKLAEGAERFRDDEWPSSQMRTIQEAGVFRWGLPEEFGGVSLSDAELLEVYAQLASACLTTMFILTQRNGACQRIAATGNDEIRRELLPPLAANELFVTVGISHLTTSRQHLKRPAVLAVESAGGYVLNGSVPWVTGAAHADAIVTGGTLADGRQLLVALATKLPGVVIHPPMHLLALSASQTAMLELKDVVVPRRFLLHGPIEQVMKHASGGGSGSLTTSALAIGATQGVLRRIHQEAERRRDLAPIFESLQEEWSELQDATSAAVRGSSSGAPVPSAESIRGRANSLVLRASQAYLAASKGAGFVVGHPAERAVREAMFFLVWSCPQPVVDAALRQFACVVEDS